MLVGTAIGVGVIGIFLGKAIVNDVFQSKLHNTTAFWILQITSNTIALFSASLIFAKYAVNDSREYLKAYKCPPLMLMILVPAIMFAGTAIIEFLSVLNQEILSFAFLKDFADWAREGEDVIAETMKSLFAMNTLWQMFFNLLVIGLLTAIAEEFLFRGSLQTIIVRWTKGNIHAAIWITAVLFSAFHVQFFGFLPRLALGAMFGYMVTWSGSIWPAVWAHFINNGTAVIATYLYQNKKIDIDPNNNHVFNYTTYIISFIIILFLFWIFKNVASGKRNIPEY